MTMKRLAAGLDRARSTRSRIGKEQAIAEALGAIADDSYALATAARIAVGRTLAIGDVRTVGVGGALLLEVVVAATGWGEDVVRACARKTGDLGEAFGLLVARVDGAEERAGMSLREVGSLFEALASTGNRASKRALLDEAFARATPLEVKYLAKALLGSIRVGAQGGVLEGAIARAFGVDVEEVRRTSALVTDPGELAVLAHARQLHAAQLEIGRPVAFMLATPLESIATPIDPALYVMEDKIDGVRAQVHKVGSTIAIFARGLERVTEAFPEVVEAFRFVPGNVALDGELVAIASDGRPRPFQALQSRLHRKTPRAEDLAQTSVAFVAYDILADQDRAVLDLPFAERRARLERFAMLRGPRSQFLLNETRRFEGVGDGERQSGGGGGDLNATLDGAFAAARERGHEGLVLKRIDAPYDAGRRGQAWIKVKRALSTLDVVITAAEEGHGRRAGVLSDYTFAVWRDGVDAVDASGAIDARANVDLVNIGKAYSGLSDDEIEVLTSRLRRLTTVKLGGARLVEPTIVIEVAFDGVQRSKRHKSGFALRFPRIVRLRDDKRPEDADRLENVEALFRAQIETGHREVVEAAPTKARARAKAKLSSNASQLSLFGEQPAHNAPKRRK
ncbi:MAG: ATP-dependent DNA ligase [Polyangiales bacterium]